MAYTTTALHIHRSALRRRQSLVLADAVGTVVAVDRGSVWITQEKDTRDIVLSRGMRFQIDRPGRTIVAAEAPSVLKLLVPPGWKERIGNALRQTAARWGRRLKRAAVPYY